MTDKPDARAVALKCAEIVRQFRHLGSGTLIGAIAHEIHEYADSLGDDEAAQTAAMPQHDEEGASHKQQRITPGSAPAASSAQSETPRVDAILVEHGKLRSNTLRYPTEQALIDLARDLELEVARLRKVLGGMR